MTKIAYCTNVHAGKSLTETRSNLQKFAIPVRDRYCPTGELGVGLWLSARSASELIGGDGLGDFAAWLAEERLVSFTFNGFPYGDFHQAVVKKDVYLPTWFDHERLEYTLQLAEIIHQLAPPGSSGSISTLPIAWGCPRPSLDKMSSAARFLADLARRLCEMERETGRLVYVCLEPEPGCVIQRSGDMVEFFKTHLLPIADEHIVRRHIRVCHDVCHAVVMCESQRDVLAAYRAAGIAVGKMQISSAVVADFDALAASDRKASFEQLSAFAEDRYLHQTTIQQGDAAPEFFADLPDALRSVGEAGQASGIWRVHFHVPVYLEEFGLLKTSQAEIIECVRASRDLCDTEHFEVETYAWNVLPKELRQVDLAAGIATELTWFSEQTAEHFGQTEL
jgi:sugar phosphate isomerase/epimerase